MPLVFMICTLAAALFMSYAMSTKENDGSKFLFACIAFVFHTVGVLNLVGTI